VTAHQPGDPYVFAVQVDQPVSQTGVYNWSADVQLQFAGGQ
jgi:hypothetical protein